MLHFKKSIEGNVSSVDLLGVIDERVSFASALGKLTSQVKVNCRGITRINSSGIKLWREFWNQLRERGATLEFIEISPATVAVTGSIFDFLRSDEVISICVPYVCTSCRQEKIVVLTKATVLKHLPQVPMEKCANCDAACELDDIPEDYFSFLIKDRTI